MQIGVPTAKWQDGLNRPSTNYPGLTQGADANIYPL